ncbi:MAG: TerB family tellurite resistance protein [Planctomycetota bacterium]|jgi:uncharacterized tellurite resistance protein B-like protein
MNEPTIEQVKTVLTSSEVRGRTMHCTFTCPEKGTAVEASAPVAAKQEGAVKKAVKRSVDRAKRGFMWRLRSKIAYAVSNAVGGGMAGQIARDVAYSATPSGGGSSAPSFGKAEKEAAILAAFNKVKHQFVWKEEAGTFISLAGAGAQGGPFMQRLAEAPITGRFEREVMARMLAQLASVDGHFAEEEKTFMASFVAEDLGTIDELLDKGDLNKAELSGVDNPAVRANMLMVGWALAMADEDLDDAEKTLLRELAVDLAVSPEDVNRARSDAQAYVFEQALEQAYEGGKKDPEAFASAVELAQRIGMTLEQAQTADVAFRKRTGA